MNCADPYSVAILVATADRPGLLAHRALPSIGDQTRLPERVLIIDDSADRAAGRLTGREVRAWHPDGMQVDFYRNRRTKGASGAWNTGLERLLRTSGDPARVYVAILDDDDRWEPGHLESCLALAQRCDLDLITAPFLRIKEGEATETVCPPRRLDAAGFLTGNPGIQASNLVCRLSVLLEAGLFDEALPSCTDRDLCIRIADLPGVRYGGTPAPTVWHYACRSRARLSTPGSALKQAGLDGFFTKYQGRMTEDERARFRARAQALFGWREGLRTPVVATASEVGPPAPQRAGAPNDPVHLIVGTVTDGERPETVSGLLADLRDLEKDPGLSGLDVLLLENGAGHDDGLRALVERERARGLRIHPIYRARDAANGGGRLPIAPARSELQAHLYVFARRRPGSVVWILDDDMRLDPLVAVEPGRFERRRQALAAALQALRRQHAEGAADIAVGTYTGAPPLPFAASVRIQTVDLAASLQWLAALNPADPLPDRGAENAVLRSGRRDCYYDLSRSETDRLETPFWATPAFPGERVGEAFTRLSLKAERILAGEPVFRPLAVEPGAAEVADGSLRRGGNTFVLDPEALRLAPNPAPVVHGRAGRRSDMVWMLLQQRYFGMQAVVTPVAVYHDRARTPVAAPDVARMVDDIRGHAMLAALEDCPRVFAATAGHGIARRQDETDGLLQRVRERLDDRLAAYRLSFHRVRGLAGVLRALATDANAWWADGAWREPAGRLRNLAATLAGRYGLETLARIEREARALDGDRVRAFIDGLPEAIAAHRGRITQLSAALPHEAERVANAMAAASALAQPPPAGTLSVLGSGAEGVALTDGERVFKVFDYWKPQDSVAARAFLGGLAGAWSGARSLHPILGYHESGTRAVLVYPYEPSEPYVGGHGPGLVDLLVECRRFGVVHRNLHPANLRVTDGRVRLIDYGADLRPLADEADFTAMCRRAWLCWRWAGHGHLKAIMRRALEDTGIPELEGFDRFHEAVLRCAGVGPPARDIVLDMAGPPGRALDYGCGNGEQARDLARQGMTVLGYDPDPSHAPRWEARCRDTAGLRFTTDHDAVRAAEPFDLIVCRRVLCTMRDDRAMQGLLHDLRALVSERGRVVVSVCDPNFTFGGTSPEARRELPPDARHEDGFVWRKTVRATGRVRCDVHRPEHRLRRAFARAGLAVADRREVPSVDLERFEPMSDHLAFDLCPLPPLPGEVTLLVKACAMEADTLDVQVPHLVSQLEGPRAFAERVLVIDPHEGEFLRQYTPGSLGGLRRAARRLVGEGWIDRIVEGPCDGEAAPLHRRWFGFAAARSHTPAGVPVAATLAGLEACRTRYVLHADADVMVGRLDRSHDHLADMLAVLTEHAGAVTVAMNIAAEQDRPYTDHGEAGAWRVESRAGMVDLVRLRNARPLSNRLEGNRPALPWHRSLDLAIARGAGTSWRGGDRRTFHVHPPNARKGDREAWYMTLDRIEHGAVPVVQHGRVEWTGGIAEWMQPPRREPFVFLVCGRAVEPGRLRRCLASITRQKGPDWGAVLFDDASEPRIAGHFDIACRALGPRCTVVRNRRRRGLLANMTTAIRSICADPETVIVTLDADDTLIGDQVLVRLAEAYARGADVTVGSMLRTDKAADYPVEFKDPRQRRGGNVWQHLRSFRKRLFDATPDDALRLDGDYVDMATDWAFMLPIIEMAEHPVHVAEPLYLHEPSGRGKGEDRAKREAIIARIMARQPTGPANGRDRHVTSSVS